VLSHDPPKRASEPRRRGKHPRGVLRYLVTDVLSAQPASGTELIDEIAYYTNPDVQTAVQALLYGTTARIAELAHRLDRA
jgi:DNA-binding PadR family transcriptional regulator